MNDRRAGENYQDTDTNTIHVYWRIHENINRIWFLGYRVHRHQSPIHIHLHRDKFVRPHHLKRNQQDSNIQTKWEDKVND